jgi:biotin carboxyl carrier protein
VALASSSSSAAGPWAPITKSILNGLKGRFTTSTSLHPIIPSSAKFTLPFVEHAKAGSGEAGDASQAIELVVEKPRNYRIESIASRDRMLVNNLDVKYLHTPELDRSNQCVIMKVSGTVSSASSPSGKARKKAVVTINSNHSTGEIEIGIFPTGSVASYSVSLPHVDNVGLSSKEASSNSSVKSPMPGKIIKVFVGDNGEVSAGEPMIILEAMKMEHVIKAPGVKGSAVKWSVASVPFQVGEFVQEGSELVKLVKKE